MAKLPQEDAMRLIEDSPVPDLPITAAIKDIIVRSPGWLELSCDTQRLLDGLAENIGRTCTPITLQLEHRWAHQKPVNPPSSDE
jgi:hypothetical protein